MTRARAYRLAVPLLMAALAVGTLIVLVLAGGVLLGFIPYPGR